MHQLEIVAPNDATIAIAGKALTFLARTDPPQLAPRIRWSIATQPGAASAASTGPVFTHTFEATGVEQVIARLDDDELICDVVVYVFKTPGGGSTIADLLRSEPPPVARTAAAFKRYGQRALTALRAS